MQVPVSLPSPDVDVGSHTDDVAAHLRPATTCDANPRDRTPRRRHRHSTTTTTTPKKHKKTN